MLDNRQGSWAPVSQDALASAGFPGVAEACRGCGGTLLGLPVAARYCPKCGSDLRALNNLPVLVASNSATGAPPQTGASTISSRPTSWPAFILQSLRFQPIPPPLPGEASRSMIVMGYARALFRLGTRYESGLGASRNTNEAHRCFFKAARLGDVDARARLTSADEAGPGPGAPHP